MREVVVIWMTKNRLKMKHIHKMISNCFAFGYFEEIDRSSFEDSDFNEDEQNSEEKKIKKY
jgi:hypothetical protein